MILLGLILILIAAGAGVLLVMGAMDMTDSIQLAMPLDTTLNVRPLGLLIAGAAVMFLLWLGFVMIRGSVRRKARRRREAKELEREEVLRREEEAREAERIRADEERTRAEQERTRELEAQQAEERRQTEAREVQAREAQDREARAREAQTHEAPTQRVQTRETEGGTVRDRDAVAPPEPGAGDEGAGRHAAPDASVDEPRSRNVADALMGREDPDPNRPHPDRQG